MPIRDLLDEVHYYAPKLKEIAKRQEAERVKAELTNQRNQNRNKRRNKRGVG